MFRGHDSAFAFCFLVRELTPLPEKTTARQALWPHSYIFSLAGHTEKHHQILYDNPFHATQ